MHSGILESRVQCLCRIDWILHDIVVVLCYVREVMV